MCIIGEIELKKILNQLNLNILLVGTQNVSNGASQTVFKLVQGTKQQGNNDPPQSITTSCKIQELTGKATSISTTTNNNSNKKKITIATNNNQQLQPQKLLVKFN
ncbi:hypothetical protein ACTFIU_001734 [Dictyostelium citrinum]